MRRYLFVFAVFFVAAFQAGSARADDRFLDIEEVTSKSGITAWLVEDHSLPVIAMEFAFGGAGAVLDPAEKQGLTRMASSTMDEGAGDMDSQTFQKTLTDNSIALSFSAGRDDFGGSLKTLTRRKDTAFRLLKLALTAPRFDAEAVERMRAANVSRLRSSLSDPDWLAARIMNDVAFAGHPYALNSGGTLTTLASITPDDLRGFVSSRLARGNLAVAVTGDITAKELAKRLDEIFGALPEKADLPGAADFTIHGGGNKHLYNKSDIPQTVIEAALPGVARKDPDWQAFQVMNQIFGGGGFGSRLTEEVREKRGLTYGIYSGAQLLDHVQILSVSASTKSENTAEVLEILRKEMEKMKSAPVTAQELADAKSYLTGSMPLMLSSTDDIAGLLLALMMDGMPMDYLDTVDEKINAVTAVDVQRVAQRVLKPGNLTVVLVGEPAGVDPVEVVKALPNVE